MAKKRGGHKKRGSEDPDEFSSTASTGTMETAHGRGYCEEEDGGGPDPLLDIVEGLEAKRPESRLRALKALHSLLSAAVCDEEIEYRQLELIRLLTGCLKRGKEEELVLACRCMGLAVVSLGAGEQGEAFVADAWEPVLGVAKSASKPPDARCAAVDAMGVMCFIAAEDDVESAIWDALHRLWRAKSKEVQAAALSAWTLVATTAVGRHMWSRSAEETLADIYLLLNSEDTDVCLAAGEAMALLVNTLELGSAASGSDAHMAEDGDDADDDDNAEGEPSCGLSEAMSRVRELARGAGESGGLRKSKVARRDLKAGFREVLAMLEDGEGPVEKIKLRHGDAVELDEMTSVMQLRFLRRFLASAFHEHMQHNPLLHDIFSFSPDRCAAPRLTAREKRMYRSPNSADAKYRAQTRGADRAMSRMMKGAMMAEDD